MGNSILLGWSLLVLLFGTGNMQLPTDNQPIISDPTSYMYDTLKGTLELADSMKEPDCNAYKAKHCFQMMANATIQAAMATDMHNKAASCREVELMGQCVEQSLSGCKMNPNMTWAGMEVLTPYVPMMRAVASSMCMSHKGEEDEEECDVKSVGQCFQGFVYVAEETSTIATCWQARQTLACVRSIMKDCHNGGVKNIVSMVMSQVENTVRTTCLPKGCHVGLATECLMSAKKAIDSPLASSQNSPLLCGYMMANLECVKEHTVNCPAEVYAGVSAGYYHLYEGTKVVCKFMEDQMGGKMDDMEEMSHALPLAAVLNSHFITHEAVCPFYKAIIEMLQGTPMKKLPPMDVVRSAMVASQIVGDYCKEEKTDSMSQCEVMTHDSMALCKPEYARQCVKHARVPHLLKNVDRFGWEVVCQELLKMFKCVHFTMSGCHNEQYEEFENMSKELVGIVGDHCPNPVMMTIKPSCGPTSKCDIRGGISHCMVAPSQDTLTGGKSCQHLNDTLMCIHNYTSGCSSIMMLPVAYKINYFIKHHVQPYCYRPLPKTMKDELLTEKLEHCSWHFMGGLEYILKHSKNFTLDMCGFLHMYNQNCSDVPMPPVVKIGLMKSANLVHSLAETHCKAYETELKAMANQPMQMSDIIEPESCQVDMITGNIVTYWISMVVNPFTPLNQRKAICGDFQMLWQVVNMTSMNCSQERHTVFQEMMMTMSKLHKEMCGMVKMTSESVSGCSIDYANHCLEEFSSLLSSSSPHHNNETCIKFYHMVKCVHNHTASCGPSQELVPIKKDMASILSVIGETCSGNVEDFSKEMCDNATAMISEFPTLDPSCDTIDANACLQMFTDAEPLLIPKPTELCMGAHKAIQCAKTKMQACTLDDAAAVAVNVTITNLMDRLNDSCSTLYAEYMSRREKQCMKLPAMQPVCSSPASCFPSSNFNDICSNAPAVKACISLKLIGCDSSIFMSSKENLAGYSQYLTFKANASCDITPTAIPSYMPPNYSQNVTCIAGGEIFSKYIFNASSSERDICRVFKSMEGCIQANHTKMPVMWKTYMAKLASIIKTQIYYHCEIAEVDLVYGNQTFNEATAYANLDPRCNFEEAAVCLSGYMNSGLFAGHYPISQRYIPCLEQLDQLKCAYDHTVHCPAPFKQRYLRLIDWVSSISDSVGICSMEGPRQCEPKEALKCVSHLGLAVTTLRDTDYQDCICAGIVPTQKCVAEKTSGCKDYKRIQVETTLHYITKQVMEHCEKRKDHEEDKCPAAEEKCSMEKVNECLGDLGKHVIALGTDGLRERHCSTIADLEDCITDNLAGCSDDHMIQVKMFRKHMPILKTVIKAMCSAEMENDKEMSRESHMCGITALYCVKDYFTMMSLGSVTALCGQVKPVLVCMKSAMETCSKDHGKLITMVADQISMTTKEMCGSEKCNPELAKTCVMEAGQMLKMAGSRMNESASVCSGIKMALTCATRHSMQCDMEKHHVLKEHIKGIEFVTERMCAEYHSNYIISAVNSSMYEMMSIGILLRSRFVTKESICPQVRAMVMGMHEMAYYMEPKDVLEMEKMIRLPGAIIDDFCMEDEEIHFMDKQPEPECNITKVVKCSESANLLQKIGEVYYNNYGWDPVCQSFEKMMCCLHHSGGGCHDDLTAMAVIKVGREAVEMVKEKCPMHDIIKRVGKTCPIPMPRCQLEEAKKNCLPAVYTIEQIQPYCSNTSRWISCAREHTVGCLAIQVAPLMRVMEYQLDMCGNSFQPYDLLRDRDETSGVTECLYKQWLTDLNDDLSPSTTSFNVFKTFCYNKQKLADCYMGLKVPMMLEYFASDTGFDMWFDNTYCKADQLEVQQLPTAEPSTCRPDMASVCISTYLATVSHYQVIPLRDRPAVCGDIWKVYECITMSTAGCSDVRKSVYEQAISIISLYHSNACPNMEYMEPMLKMEGFCSVKLAMYIIEEFGKYLSTASPHDDEKTCQKIHHLMKYVHGSVKGCSPTDWDQLLPPLHAIKSMVGNRCPLLTAVTCDTARWNETVVHASCNTTKAMKCLKDFEVHAKNMTNAESSICSMFYEATGCAIDNILLCEPKDTQEVNMTLTIMWSTLGKHCLMHSDPSQVPPGVQALLSESCLAPPECSVMWENCLPEEDMCGGGVSYDGNFGYGFGSGGFGSPSDGSGGLGLPSSVLNSSQLIDGQNNMTDTKMCIEKKLSGCDEHIQRSLIKDITFWSGMMSAAYQRPCDIVPSMLVPVAPQNETTLMSVDCGISFLMKMIAYLHNETATDMDLCDVFMNVTQCFRHGMANMSSIWKGVFGVVMQKIEEQTKFRCAITEMAARDMKEMMRNMTEDMKSSSMMSMDMTEPMSCDRAKAESCLQSYVAYSVFSGAFPIKDRSTLCSKRKKMKHCLVEATAHCWSTTRYKYLNVLEWSSMMGDSMEVCVENDYGKEIAEAFEPKCEPKEAIKCVGHMGYGVMVHKKFMPNSMCSGIAPVFHCVSEKMWGCPAYKRMYVERTLYDMTHLAMNLCHHQKPKQEMMTDCMERDEKSMCNIPEAMHCVSSAHSKFMESEDWNDVCRQMPHVRNCVMQHLSGCEECHRDGVHELLKGLYNKLADHCPNMECDVCGAMSCMDDFHDKDRSEKSMTCMDLWKIKQCVGGKIGHCSDREKEYVEKKMKMAVNMTKAPMMCKENIEVGHCLMELEMVTNKILGLSSLPSVSDYVIAAKNETMPTDMTRPDDQPMPTEPRADNRTMADKVSEEMDKLIHTMNDCPDHEDKEKKMDDLKSLCHRAEDLWKCVEPNLHQMSENGQMIQKLMYIIKEGVTRRCYSDAKSLKCFSCRGARSNAECNKEPIQTCRGQNQMCYTGTDNGLISKGCTKRMPLLHTSQCVMGTMGMKCVSFCDKTQCNIEEKRVVMDPPSCNMKAAMMCSIGLVKSMMESKGMHCGLTKEALHCIHMNTKDCMSKSEGVISHISGEMLRSPALIKCYVQPMPCRCGHCATVTYGNILRNPFIMMEDKCKLAAVTQQSIRRSLIIDDCTMEDHMHLHTSTQLAKLLIGDSCDKMMNKDMMDNEMIYPAVHNDKCNVMVAQSCVDVAPLEEMIRYVDHDGMREKICKSVGKVVYCMHHYLSGCDMSKFTTAMNETVQHLNRTIHMKLSYVNNICNVTKMVNVIKKMMNESTLQEQMSHMMEGVSQMMSGVLKDEEAKDTFNKMSEVIRGEVKKPSRCKVTLALRHCLAHLTGASALDADFCLTLNKTHECIHFLTEGCVTVQKAPAVFLFMKLVHHIDPYAAYRCQIMRNNMTEEVMSDMEKDDPSVRVSKAAGHFVESIYRAYTAPSMNSTFDICHAAVDLDNSVYQVQLPPVGRVFLKDMAMLTASFRDVTCMNAIKMAIAVNVSAMNCSMDDVLCTTIKDMTKDLANMETWPTEPDTCRVSEAAMCMTSYMLRVLSSPFAPLSEHADICWEEKAMAVCVMNATKTCSQTMQNHFTMAVDGFHNLTYPICSKITDMREPQCAAAKYCLHSIGYHVFKPRSSYDAEFVQDVCWGSKAAIACVKHHAYNCTDIELSHIKESLYIMSNITSHMCPDVAKEYCSLTALQPRDVGQKCQENNLRMCAHTLGNHMMNYMLSHDDKCGKLEEAVYCMVGNSSNCHPHIIDEIGKLVHLTAGAANLTCPSVGSLVENMMPVCPVMGNCSLTTVLTNISTILDSGVKGTLSGFLCQNHVEPYMNNAGPLTDGCNAIEITILKRAMQAGYNALQELPCITEFVGLSYVDQHTKNLAKCADSYVENVTMMIIQPEYGFWDICKGAKLLDTCLTNELVKSETPTEMIYGLVMNGTAQHIREFVNKTCQFQDLSGEPKLSLNAEPVTCQSDVAVAYVVTYAVRAVFQGALQYKDKMSLCYETEMVRDYIKNYTNTCSMSVISQLKTVLHLHESLVMESGFCPEEIVSHWKEEMAQMMGEKMSGYELASKLFETKGMMGDDMKEDDKSMAEWNKGMMGYDDMSEERDSDMKEDGYMSDMKMECQPWKLSHCLVSLGYHMTGHAENGSMLMHGERNHFCDVLAKETESCSRRYMYKCDNVTKHILYDLAAPMLSLAVKHCGNHTSMTDGHIEKMTSSMDWTDKMSEKDSKMEMSDNYSEWDERESEKDKVRSMLSDMFEKSDRSAAMTELVQHVAKFSMFDDNRMVRDLSKVEMEEIQMMFETYDDRLATMDNSHCVDPMKVKGEDKCNPLKALACIHAVDMEILDTSSTKERLCVKHAIAVRCAISSTKKCDHNTFTSMLIHEAFKNMMSKVKEGHKCPTVVKTPCMEEDEMCKINEVPECLSKLREYLMEASKMTNGLPAHQHVCSMLPKVLYCLVEKQRHCPRQMATQMYEGLETTTGLLTKMCQNMPKFACVSSLIWKTAGVMTISVDIGTVGSHYQALKYAADHKMTNGSMNKPAATMATKNNDMASMYNSTAEDHKLSVLKLLKHMLENKDDCMEKDDDDMMHKEMDDSAYKFLKGMMDVFRYVAMDSKLVEDNDEFKHMMQLHLLHLARMKDVDEGEDHDIIQMLMHKLMNMEAGDEMHGNMTYPPNMTDPNMTTEKMESFMEIMKMGYPKLVGAVMKRVITMEDSGKLLKYVFHRMTTSKLKQVMETIENEDMNKMSEDMREKMAKLKDEMEETKEEMISRDKEMGEEMKTGMMEMLRKMAGEHMEYTRLMNNSEKMMEFLHEHMEMKTKRKKAMCMELWDAWKCAESMMSLVSRQMRGLVNMTLHAIAETGHAYCQPQKCYSCMGVTDNEECNKQGKMACMDGQVCYTKVTEGRVTKGCAYGFEVNKEMNTGEWCYGKDCNKPKYGVMKEPELCKPMEALQCVFQSLPVMMAEGHLDSRNMYKQLYCIEHHTKDCLQDDNKELRKLGKWMKHALMEGQCSGQMSEYVCGTRSVMLLASSLTNPSMTRKGLCWQLNDTLNTMKLAVHYNQCSEYEVVEAHKGIELIYSIIGHDFCPKMMSMESMCNASEMMASMESTTCDMAGIEECTRGLQLVGKLNEMGMTGGMSHGGHDLRDMSYFCKLVDDTLKCVGKKTAKCTDQQKQTVHDILAPHLGPVIDHCPSIKMVTDVCYPDKTPPPRCEVGLAIMNCMKYDSEPFNEQNLPTICGNAKSEINSTLRCLYNYTSGCTAVQGAPLYMLVHQTVVSKLALCGVLNNSKEMENVYARLSYGEILSEDQRGFLDMLFNGVMNHVIGMPELDNEKSPVLKLLGKAIHMRMEMKNLTAINKTMIKYMVDGGNEMMMKMYSLQAKMNTDETFGLAKCLIHYTTQMTRALMYPTLFKLTMCEINWATIQCMHDLELSPPGMIVNMKVINEMAMETEMHCKSYMEDKIHMGMKVANVTKQVLVNLKDKDAMPELRNMTTNDLMEKMMNMSADDMMKLMNHTEFRDAIAGMVQGDSNCDTWNISMHISFSMLQIQTGGFNRFSEWTNICWGINAMNYTVVPEVMKCMKETQEIYLAIIRALQKSMNPICMSTEMMTERPKCSVEKASACLLPLIEMYSTRATPNDRLCRQVRSSLLCLKSYLLPCGESDRQLIDGALSFVRSIVGDSCPYIMAAVSCNVDPVASTQRLCNVTQAKQCANSMKMMYQKSPDPTAICPKLPETLQCIEYNMSGCSPAEIMDGLDYAELFVEKVVEMCHKADISPFSESCLPPVNCSLTGATDCLKAFGDLSSITCSDIDLAMKCIQAQSSGCNFVQQQIISSQVLILSPYFPPNCPAYTDTSYNLIAMEAMNISSCRRNLTTSLTASLVDTPNAAKNVCKSIHEFYACANVSTYGLAQFGFLGNTYKVTGDTVKLVCEHMMKNVAKDTSKMTETASNTASTCDLPRAAACMSVYTVPTILAGVMPQKDKDVFCNVGGPYTDLYTCIYTSLTGCSNATLEPFHALGAVFTSAVDYSHVCARDFMTCSPHNAMDCTMDAWKNVSPTAIYETLLRQTSRNHSSAQGSDQVCGAIEESHKCMTRNLHGCKEDVNAKVRETMDTDLCLGYDTSSGCMSRMMMEAEKAAEMPKCLADRGLDWTKAKCNMTSANHCIMDLFKHLKSPFKDCTLLHGHYVKALECHSYHTNLCDATTKMVANILLRKAAQMVYEICPRLVTTPCEEPENCQIEEARHCMDALHYIVHKHRDLSKQDKCMLMDLSNLCILEKTKDCSYWGKSVMTEYMNEFMMGTNLTTCKHDFKYCMSGVLTGALGIVSGDVLVARIAHQWESTKLEMATSLMKPMTSDWTNLPGVMSKHFDEDRMKMMEDLRSKVMATMSSDMGLMMSLRDGTSMSSENMTAIAGSTRYMLNIIMGGEDDFLMVHAKMKTVQCMAFKDTMHCVQSHLANTHMAEDKLDLVNSTLMKVKDIVMDMCMAETSCADMEDLTACDLKDAMTITLTQLRMVMNASLVGFCNGLDKAASDLYRAYSGCTGDVRTYFESVRSTLSTTGIAMCRAPIPCEITEAEKCLSDYEANGSPTCSVYESTLNCLDTKLGGCNDTVVTALHQRLESVRADKGNNCEKLPEFNINSARSILLAEGGPAKSLEVSLAQAPSTVCGGRADCYIHIRVEIHHDPDTKAPKCKNNELIPQVMVQQTTTDPCQFRFTDNNYDTVQKISLAASVDNRYDGEQKAIINVIAEKYAGGSKVLTRQIANYTVTVKDMDSKAICYAYGDPSIISFDKLSHKHLYERESVLYKHTTMPLEVRIFSQTCGGPTKKCICAVMVKSVDDVYVVDMCRRRSDSATAVIRPTTKLYKKGGLTSGTKFYRIGGGSTKIVIFPTGTRVYIVHANNMLNAFVIASAFDMYHTEGLCGYYDGSTHNDYIKADGKTVPDDDITETEKAFSLTPKAFATVWRPYDSYFQGVSASTFEFPGYCTCSADASVPNSCSSMQLVETCDLVSGKSVNLVGEDEVTTADKRKRRQTTDPTSDLAGDTETVEPVAITTNEYAVSVCNQILTSKLVTDCVTIDALTAADVTSYNSSCITDVLFGNSTDSTLTIIKVACEVEVGKNETNLDSDPAAQSIIVQIEALLCENNCSDNGVCQAEGVCQCFQHWIGDDCSIGEHTPPTVTSLQSTGLCDSTSGTCTQVAVYGDKFTDSLGTLMCQYEPLTIDSTGVTANGAVTKTAASYISNTQVACPISGSASTLKAMNIRVSNDDENFSSPLLYVTYNPTCYDCSTDTSTCTPTTTGCDIGGVCYQSGASNPGDTCQICHPASSTSVWTQLGHAQCVSASATQAPTTTPRPTTQQPTTPRPTTTQAPTAAPQDNEMQTIVIALGVVAGVLLLVVVVLTVKVCQTSSHDENKSSSGRSSIEGHKDFDNLAYNDFEKRKNDYATGVGQPIGSKADPYATVSTFNEQKRVYDNAPQETGKDISSHL